MVRCNSIDDKYICPFTDFGFKKLFGTEPNKDLLIDFLNQLLQKSEGRIVDLTYMSKEQLGRVYNDRNAVYDIYCKNEKDERFIVELQKVEQTYFKDRSIYYSTFPIQNQAKKGKKWNFELKSVYFIGILDFCFDDDKDNDEVFHHDVKLIDTTTGKVFYDKLNYVYLEMPKFTKTVDELESGFDKWLYVLANLEDLNSRPAKLQEKIFKKLFHIAEIENYDEREYADYLASLKHYRDYVNSIDTAINKGRIEGKIEGKFETAREAKKEGLSAKVISKITGLTIEEIEKL